MSNPTAPSDASENTPQMQTHSAPTKRIFISTGEVSGDLQGALLAHALHRQASIEGFSVEISALGGPRMQEAGVHLIGNTTTIGSVGVFEALPYLLPTLQIQRRAKQALREAPPDLVILIDYMNPNLAMGQFLKSHMPEVPVIYYISPQQWVWAFSVKDTERIVRNSDRMLAIFKQEAAYFEQFGADVRWVGHPLMDRFPESTDRVGARERLGLDPTDSIVTLLPASRRQEVKYLLPILFEAARQLQAQRPDVAFLIPVSSAGFQPIMTQAVVDYGLNGQVIERNTQDAIAAADVAITKSGTANLEIALMNVPQVVAYRISPLSAWILHRILKFSAAFVSPVNLAVMKPIVPEFIQWQATPEIIASRTLELLEDSTARESMLAGYREMRAALGTPGVCDRAAAEILSLLNKQFSRGGSEN